MNNPDYFIFTMWGTILIIFGIGMSFFKYRVVLFGTVVHYGKIVRVEKVESNLSVSLLFGFFNNRYFAFVEFTYNDIKVMSPLISYVFNLYENKIGQDVSFYYHPKFPDRIYLKTNALWLFFPLYIIALGLIFVAL